MTENIIRIRHPFDITKLAAVYHFDFKHLYLEVLKNIQIIVFFMFFQEEFINIGFSFNSQARYQGTRVCAAVRSQSMYMKAVGQLFLNDLLLKSAK